jgi:succinate dehydrogenase/fumarate reductase flavoprotein subunit
VTRDRFNDILKRDKGFDFGEVREQITETMSRYVNVLRNGDGLRKAIETLDKISVEKREQLRLGRERSSKELADLMEVRNMLTVARMVTSATLISQGSVPRRLRRGSSFQ